MNQEINFYQTNGDIFQSISALSLKAIEDKKNIFIFCKNENLIKELDNALWSYGRNKFIPHITIFDSGFDFLRQPILISNQEKNLNNASYLIFLDQPSSNFIKGFSRVFYFFDKGHLKSDITPHNFYKKENSKWIKSNL